MYSNLFAGFKLFAELKDSSRSTPFVFKRLAQFNIPANVFMNSYDALPVPPNIKIGHDESGRPDPGSPTARTFQYDEKWLKQVDWKRPPRYLKVVDISGKCDQNSLNQDHQERPCSPTNGRSFLVSLSIATNLSWPIPKGSGGGGGMGGMDAMGGGGGMMAGGGAAPPPGIGAAGPAGGAAGPAGGGAGGM